LQAQMLRELNAMPHRKVLNPFREELWSGIAGVKYNRIELSGTALNGR
jgi:hypothetical protein